MTEQHLFLLGSGIFFVLGVAFLLAGFPSWHTMRRAKRGKFSSTLYSSGIYTEHGMVNSESGEVFPQSKPSETFHLVNR